MSESLNSALVECVKACGGSGQVGPKLWPEKSQSAAQRALLDCLNDDRPAKLSPEQVLFILRLARVRGFHVGMEFLCADLGYAAPVPIAPKDEADDLRRQVVEISKTLQASLARLEMLDRPALRAAS